MMPTLLTINITAHIRNDKRRPNRASTNSTQRYTTSPINRNGLTHCTKACHASSGVGTQGLKVIPTTNANNTAEAKDTKKYTPKIIRSTQIQHTSISIYHHSGPQGLLKNKGSFFFFPVHNTGRNLKFDSLSRQTMGDVAHAVYSAISAVMIVFMDRYVANYITRAGLAECSAKSFRTLTVTPAALSALLAASSTFYFAFASGESGVCGMYVFMSTASLAVWAPCVFVMAMLLVPKGIVICAEEPDADGQPPQVDAPVFSRESSPDVEDGHYRKTVTHTDDKDAAEGTELQDISEHLRAQKPEAESKDRDPDEYSMAIATMHRRLERGASRPMTPVRIGFDDTEMVDIDFESSGDGESFEDDDDTFTEDARVLTEDKYDEDLRTRIWVLVLLCMFAFGISCMVGRLNGGAVGAGVRNCGIKQFEIYQLLTMAMCFLAAGTVAGLRSVVIESNGMALWISRVSALAMWAMICILVIALMDYTVGDADENNRIAMTLRMYNVFFPLVMEFFWILPYVLNDFGTVAISLAGRARSARAHRKRERKRRRTKADDPLHKHNRTLPIHAQLETMIRMSEAQARASAQKDGNAHALTRVDWPDSFRDASDDDKESDDERPELEAAWKSFRGNESALRFLRAYAYKSMRSDAVDFAALVTIFLPGEPDIDFSTLSYIYQTYVHPSGKRSLVLSAEVRDTVKSAMQRVESDALAGGSTVWTGAGPFHAAWEEVRPQIENDIARGFIGDATYTQYLSGAPAPQADLTLPGASRASRFYRLKKYLRASIAHPTGNKNISHSS